MESLAAMLPVGPQDELAHRGARRRATRYPMHADVKVVGAEASEGVVLNASAGGLRVALDRGYREGQRIELDIELVNDRVSREAAEVVWSRELPDGWLVGLRFVR